ncbi:hypothetical protein FHS20_004284 [Phyllobacterium endophyticum]|nr:hypothetical protein [Phyllobacterium endophyticum]
MTTTICPISNEPVDLISTASDYSEFNCPSCGRFRISPAALKLIVNHSRRRRESLLDKARADAQGGDGIPFIRNIL